MARIRIIALVIVVSAVSTLLHAQEAHRQILHQKLGQILQTQDSEPRSAGLAVLPYLFQEAAGIVDRDRESDANGADTVITACVNKAIDSNDVTGSVYKGPTTVSRVNSGVSLDHVAVIVVALGLLEIAIYCADDANADGRTQIERITDGDCPLTH